MLREEIDEYNVSCNLKPQEEDIVRKKDYKVVFFGGSSRVVILHKFLLSSLLD